MGKKIHGFGHIGSDAFIEKWLAERSQDVYPEGHAKAGQQKEQRRLNDGGMLYLLDQKGKAAAWRMDYKHNGVPRMISLGTYERVKLKPARDKADPLRAQIVAGIDPSAERKQAKIEKKRKTVLVEVNPGFFPKGTPAPHVAPHGSFLHVASLFHTKKVKVQDWQKDNADRFLRTLKNHWVPSIGLKRLGEITADDMRPVLHALQEANKMETASKCREYVRQVFEYGADHPEKFCSENPGMLLKVGRVKVKHHPKMKNHRRLGELLRVIDRDRDYVASRAALLQIMLFQRTRNTSEMAWDEIDFGRAEWTLSAWRMKQELLDKQNGEDHIVPLPPQAIQVLLELKAMQDQDPKLRGTKYVFSKAFDKHVSGKEMIAVMRRGGFDKSECNNHGMRGTAKSMMIDKLDMAAHDHHIETHMHHVYQGPHGDTYTEAEYIPHRRLVMMRWANALDAMRADRFVPVDPVARLMADVANSELFELAQAA
jgi:integrase